ncbi:hypothetical protein HDR58_10775 [bacterium]|nr:hypothetical protein [bacterium]
MITPIHANLNTYNKQTYNKQIQPNFQGYNRVSITNASSEKAFRKVEFAGRKFFNIFFDFLGKDKYSELYTKFLETDSKSQDYIELLSIISQKLSNQKTVEINLETNRIENIAKSKSPHIFIMNHDNQSKDPKMLAFFNTLLNFKYLESGVAATCPRPRIILNEDILLSMSKLNRAIFEKLGATGIDASIHSADSRANASVFLKLIKQFLNKEINIFIFPEGRNAVKKKAPLSEKFQLGVAELTAKIADRMPEVNITPLGFAYGKKSQPDSIYVGETVVLKKVGAYMEASLGNITSPFAKDNFKQFFGDKISAVLTENSVPVKGKELPKFIGGILCENLRICKEEARSAIK